MVLTSVKDEAKLQAEASRLAALGLPHYAYREPDMGNQLTAVAFGPVVGEQRQAFRRLQLLKS